MPKGSKFARASYALFSVAVLLALLKLGGITGTKPLFLRVAPATPLAKAAEPSSMRDEREDETLDLPDADGPALESVGRTTERPASRLAGEGRETPIFYRPSSEKRNPDDEPVCGNLGNFPESSRVVFPMPEEYFGSYEDTWGAARPQGGHEGTDLISPTGTPLYAITDGTLVPVKRANGNGWNRLGGYTAMLQVAYDAGPIRKGDLFYYAHMDEERALPLGTKVQAGEQVGVAGDTGEGREVTRGKFPPHLHLGWYDASGSEKRTRVESGAMNPYPLLLWLEAHGGAISGGKDASYCEALQEPVPEPTSTSPDLDTGDPQDARPSPVVGSSQDDRGSPERESSADDDPEAGPADKAKERGEAREEGGENRVSRTFAGDGALQTGVRETRPLPPGSGQPSSASALGAQAPDEAKGKEGSDGRDATDAWNKERDEPSHQPARRKTTESRPDHSDGVGSAGRRRCVTLQGGGTKAERYASITRAKDSETGRRAPIKYGEWLKLIRKDPELRVSRGENKGLTLWTGHPDREEIRFDLCGGDVVVENPDGSTTGKMREIAGALGAKVKSDSEG